MAYGSAGELQQGVTDMPYDIGNVRCENGPAANHVRIGWYRSVYNIPHAFAVCSFADELAAAAGADPMDYLRRLIGASRKIDLSAIGVDYPNYGASIDDYPIDTGRMRRVLDIAAKASGWGGKPPARQGRGVAVHRSFLTYVAVVVEVAVDDQGQISVPRVDMAVDCGLVVNPDRVRAQMEEAPSSWVSAMRSTATSRSSGAKSLKVIEAGQYGLEPWRFEGIDNTDGRVLHFSTHPGDSSSALANGFVITATAVGDSSEFSFSTSQGGFSFRASDVSYGNGIYRLGGRVYVDRVPVTTVFLSFEYTI